MLRIDTYRSTVCYSFLRYVTLREAKKQVLVLHNNYFYLCQLVTRWSSTANHRPVRLQPERCIFEQLIFDNIWSHHDLDL